MSYNTTILRYLRCWDWGKGLNRAIDMFSEHIIDMVIVGGYIYLYTGDYGHRTSLFVSMRHFYIGCHYRSAPSLEDIDVVRFMDTFCVLCWFWDYGGQPIILDCPVSVIGFDIL